ncbi:TetR/AcrR family transcriptional regulator [Roseococcus sp.]|uniref:TetR/AcrR family transcriptional regulator n=1 Tax=Roseococcus sp. TaxID=2109646 RepID=UPI003BAB9D61
MSGTEKKPSAKTAPGRNAAGPSTGGAAKRAGGTLGRPSLRPSLLDAALDIVASDGVSGLTYRSLSIRTGITKSGLLYHFNSKEDLLEAITARLIERYAEARRRASESLSESPTRELEGYAISSMNNHSNLDSASAKLKLSGVWSGESGRKYFKERLEGMSSGLGFERTSIVHLAVEGLWFVELFGLSPFSDEQRSRVAEILLDMAGGSDLPAASSQ